jgi:exodeoxyribonuclease VII large subunit
MNPDFFAADGPTRPRVWSVGALARAVGDALDARFNPVAVRGEISGFTQAASGHCYFSLKDETGQLRCVLFRRAASLLGFTLREGDLVEARGRLAVYEARGSLQLVVESMARAGQGALFEQFLRQKAKLEAEGQFDATRKRGLPAMPRAIGIVTSLQAAALHDVLTTLLRRVPHVPLLIAPASVQGAGAPQELATALQALYRRTAPTAVTAEPPIDLILLVRGGGSIEDLWAFNDEQLARTLVQSPVPVISGVGHETDFTIADFVADARAATPTAAAELASMPRAQHLAVLDEQAARLQRALRHRLDGEAQRLDGLAARWRPPAERVAVERLRLARAAARLAQVAHGRIPQERARVERLDGALRTAWRLQWERRQTTLAQTAERLPRACGSLLAALHQRLDGAGVRLALLDPRLVLERGYAWLEDSGGKPVPRAAPVVTDSTLVAVLADGRIDLKVTGRRLNGPAAVKRATIDR